MRAPWNRALTGCLQMIVRDPHDIGIETGEVELGELWPRPFEELLEALTIEQRRSLVLLALADVAVWPQVEAAALPHLNELLAPEAQPPVAVSTQEARTSGATSAAFDMALQLRAVARDPERLPLDLRRLVHLLARSTPSPIAYWERWLRRVVPQAVAQTPDEALALARGALDATLAGLPERWRFAAGTYDEESGAAVGIAEDGRPGLVRELARFEPVKVVNGRLETRVTTSAPLGAYRIGFLFQSVFAEDALAAADLGFYDDARCVDAQTGAEWVFPNDA